MTLEKSMEVLTAYQQSKPRFVQSEKVPHRRTKFNQEMHLEIFL